MTTRKELVAALQLRCRSTTFGDRIRNLDEFVALSRCHRKHAIRLPRKQPVTAKAPRECNRLHDEPVRQALTVLWEAADRVCGKRLKALIPLDNALERLDHLDLDPVIMAKLLELSAATFDRMPANADLEIDGQRKRRKGVDSAIRRSIPVRTFADWRDPEPGSFEIDMVKHCGVSKTEGEFVHSLTLTDIASSWTECVATRTRNQMLGIEAFEKVAADLPFAMPGVDSDNDTASMKQTVFDYRKGHAPEQTRSWAYRQNDQAWVEQKNGPVLRRLVGYGRLSGSDARNALAQLYASSRLYINYFQPSFKLKSRRTTRARAQGLPCAGDAVRSTSGTRQRRTRFQGKLKAQFSSLDPVRLLQEMRTAQQTLSDFAAHGGRAEAAPAGESDVVVFLASPSSAWNERETRPT